MIRRRSDGSDRGGKGMAWRRRLIEPFLHPYGRPLAVVADGDRLIREEQVIAELEDHGWVLEPFEDPFIIRYKYETKILPKILGLKEGHSFRHRWMILFDEAIDPVDLRKRVPYDFLRYADVRSVRLKDLFPLLDPVVLAELERSDFDRLDSAYGRYVHRPYGEMESRDFVLRHVYGVPLETVNTEAELLSHLLRLAVERRRLPQGLIEHLLRELEVHDAFHGWPLRRLLEDRQAFLRFLQERWERYEEQRTLQVRSAFEVHPAEGVREDSAIYGTIRDSVTLPFEHEKVRPYVERLIMTGEIVSRTPIVQEKDARERLHLLLQTLEQELPESHAGHEEWVRFAFTWAELGRWMSERSDVPEAMRTQYIDLERRVDFLFKEWMLNRYKLLMTLPPVSPVMVHHLPHYMKHNLTPNLAHRSRQGASTRKRRLALLVIDGLSMEQWSVLKDVLRAPRSAAVQLPRYQLKERALFAWVPTITEVSRLALFSGIRPIDRPEAFMELKQEATLWFQFWESQELSRERIAFFKGLRGSVPEEVVEVVHGENEVIGLVVDEVDRMLHGMQLGRKGMLQQVRLWAEEGLLFHLLALLLEKGYIIELTADHGNVEAIGSGRLQEGVRAELRGARVRLYDSERLRAEAQRRVPGSIDWPGYGLPKDAFFLLAPARRAFVGEGERIVTHGGISLEEVIVPWITLEPQGTVDGS